MSKIITFAFNGPVRSGWVILSHSDPRGGRTSIGVLVTGTIYGPDGKIAKSAMTWEDAAAGLALRMNGGDWPSFVKGAASKNRVRMSVPDEMDPVTFYVEFDPDPDQGANGRKEPRVLHPDFATIEDDKF